MQADKKHLESRAGEGATLVLTIDPGLLEELAQRTDDIPSTVRYLLRSFVDARPAARPTDNSQLQSALDALDALHAEHGVLSDEFPSF